MAEEPTNQEDAGTDVPPPAPVETDGGNVPVNQPDPGIPAQTPPVEPPVLTFPPAPVDTTQSPAPELPVSQPAPPDEPQNPEPEPPAGQPVQPSPMPSPLPGNPPISQPGVAKFLENKSRWRELLQKIYANRRQKKLDNVNKLYQFIQKRKTVTKRDVQLFMLCKHTTALDYLDILIKQNQIRRVGAFHHKDTRYQILP
jgi:hypothetical protein